MFRFHIITLFPELFALYCSTSIIGRGCSGGALQIKLYNPREFCIDKYRRVDDTPYGGGAGMVMKPEPIFAAFETVERKPDTPVILMSPRGEHLTQTLAHQFAETGELTIICGHYEGIDERVTTLATHEISIGDFILTGGELPALTIIDAVGRLIPGVLGQALSLADESFTNGLLEASQYTKPPDFRGMIVPEVLRNGDHKAIVKWRRQEALRITHQRRPDLLEHTDLSEEDRLFIERLKSN